MLKSCDTVLQLVLVLATGFHVTVSDYSRQCYCVILIEIVKYGVA